MEYKRDDYKTTFEIPDTLTVREQLKYFSATSNDDNEMFIRYWEGLKAVVKNWKSEVIPSMDIDLEKTTNPDATSLIIWAGIQGVVHMNKLKDVPKN